MSRDKLSRVAVGMSVGLILCCTKLIAQTNTFPSSGNVGIGTTAPIQPLTVNGTVLITDDVGAGSGLIVNNGYGGTSNIPVAEFNYDTINGAATAMYINGGAGATAGNVGIGTTSPVAPLHLVANPSYGNNWGAGQVSSAGLLVDPFPNSSSSVMGLTISGGNHNASSNLGWVSNMVGVNAYYSSTLDTLKRFSTSGGFTNSMAITLSSDGTQVGGNRMSFWTGNAGDPVERTVITSSGNVGIGTTTPGALLEVDGNIKLTAGSGASVTFPDGTVQSTAYAGTTCPAGGDYAESIDITGDKHEYEPGDVMVIDPSHPGHFLKSSEPYSTLVAGIYSTKPGFVGRRQTTDPKTSTTEIPMAMVGVVPTKVSAENGPIKVGDLLVTSSTRGYVMKGTDRNVMVGAVVGKALAKLDNGTGTIEVLVSLQ